MQQIKRQMDTDDHYVGGNHVDFIVIHDTGNYTDSDEANANYFCTGSRGASAHYFVDEDSITQIVENCNGAWHVGDGHGKYGITNLNSLGVEMCNTKGAIAEKTIENTLWLVKRLQAKYNVPLDKVVRHYDASRKLCPANMMANNWALWHEFKRRLVGATDEVTSDYGLAKVNAESGLNIREKASTDSARIGTLKHNQEVRICSMSNGWANIYFGSHGGWVKAEFLNIYKVFKKKEAPKPQSPTPKQTFFRVVCDSFIERENAEDLQARLKAKGVESFLAPFSLGGKDYLRVICDSYTVRANAEEKQKELTELGFSSFLDTFQK